MRLPKRGKAASPTVLLSLHQGLPVAPEDRTRVTVTVPEAGNPVTVTCGGGDTFAEPAGSQHLVRAVPFSVLTLEYLASRRTWYAVDGDLPASNGAVESRPELETVLLEILGDYQSGTGAFGVGRSQMKAETLALIITQRIRKKRAETEGEAAA